MTMPQKSGKRAGSNPINEPAFLVLGKLRRAHGVMGEIPMEVYTRLLDLLAPENEVFVGENHQPYRIEKTRPKQDLLLLKFKGIDDRTTASELTNQLVYIKTDRLEPLTDGEFYYHQLIGLQVYEEGDRYLGTLTEVLETGANDVYLIQNDSGEEVLIPATEEMILEINPDQEKMIVAKMEWYREGD